VTHDSANCKEIFAMLSEYLDMELPAGTCEQIEEHLAGCPPCVEFLDSLRKTVDLCRGSEPGVRPTPLTAEARDELERAWREMLRRRTPPETGS
jgi:RNA polymerase sigma-70 factor (ECF subfamily)